MSHTKFIEERAAGILPERGTTRVDFRTWDGTVAHARILHAEAKFRKQKAFVLELVRKGGVPHE